VPVWILVLIGIVLVAVLAAPSDHFKWLSIVLGGAVVVSFIIQLAIPQKAGLVSRMMASIGGSIILLAVATAVLLPFSA
jgi:predicted phage tail protein